MTRVLKFPYLVDKYYFLSCMHRGHDRDFIWGKRGFSSGEEHDRINKARWNQKLPTDAIVFSLGDTAFTNLAEDHLWDIFTQFNFKELYLSPGNHTAGWRDIYYRELEKQFGLRDQEVYPLYLNIDENKTVIFMPNYYEITVGKQFCVLSHYPVISHVHQSKGSFGIFGHCHNNLQFTQKEYTNGKRLDVCLESFGRPVSFEEVMKIMNTKSLDSWDHHS